MVTLHQSDRSRGRKHIAAVERDNKLLHIVKPTRKENMKGNLLCRHLRCLFGNCGFIPPRLSQFRRETSSYTVRGIVECLFSSNLLGNWHGIFKSPIGTSALVLGAQGIQTYPAKVTNTHVRFVKPLDVKTANAHGHKSDFFFDLNWSHL